MYIMTTNISSVDVIICPRKGLVGLSGLERGVNIDWALLCCVCYIAECAKNPIKSRQCSY